MYMLSFRRRQYREQPLLPPAARAQDAYDLILLLIFDIAGRIVRAAIKSHRRWQEHSKVLRDMTSQSTTDAATTIHY